MDKMLEEPLVDFDFGDKWDDKNGGSNFQIDSDEKVKGKRGRCHFCKNDGKIIVKNAKVVVLHAK